MVRHKLTIEEAKAMIATDPKNANRLIGYAILFITIIAAIIISFVYLILSGG